MQPTDCGIFSENMVIIGKKAASVLPEAVDAVRRRFSSVLNKTSPAATCIALRFSQLFLYMYSCTKGAYLSNTSMLIPSHDIILR